MLALRPCTVVEMSARDPAIDAGYWGQLGNGSLLVANRGLGTLAQVFPAFGLVNHVLTASGVIIIVLAATPMGSIALALKCINAGLQCLDLRCIALVSVLASPFGGSSNERWIAFDFSQCVIDVHKVPLMPPASHVGVQSRPQVLVVVSN